MAGSFAAGQPRPLRLARCTAARGRLRPSVPSAYKKHSRGRNHKTTWKRGAPIRNAPESRSVAAFTTTISAPVSSPPRPEKVVRPRTPSMSSPPPTRKRTSSGVFQVDEAEPPPKKTEQVKPKAEGAKKSKVLNGRRKGTETEEGKEKKIIDVFDANVKTTCVTAFKESDSWD